MEDRTSQTCTTATGQVIGFGEFGDLDKPVSTIIYLHGLPGSRYEAGLWAQTARQMHIRLVSIDRPGVGLSMRLASSPQAAGSDDDNALIARYPSHVAAVATHLSLTNFHIIGVSGGGPYAISCAAAAASPQQLPGLHSVAVVAGLCPRDLPQTGMSILQRLAFRGMDLIPHALVRWFWDTFVGSAARHEDPAVLEGKLRQSLVAQRKQAHKHPADVEDLDMVIENEENFQAMLGSMRHAFIQGSEGYVEDAARVSRPWGVDDLMAKVPTRLWYCGRDGLAPAGMGRALAERIGDKASFVEYEADSHAGVVVRHQEEVFGWLLEAESV